MKQWIKKAAALVLMAALLLESLPQLLYQTSAQNESAYPDLSAWVWQQADENEAYILQEYANGNADAYLQQRIDKAKELQLENWIGQDGFVNEAFLQKADVRLLERGGGRILNPKYLPENSITPYYTSSADQLSVLSQYYCGDVDLGGYGTISNSVWTLSDGTKSFCANGLFAPPYDGQVGSDLQVVDLPELRKALFYGYGGPQNLLAGLGWSEDAQIVLTNELVSKAYCGTCIAQEALDGLHWNATVSAVWDYIQSQPDPSGYIAYVLEFSGEAMSWQNVITPYQHLAFGKYTGYISVKKESSDTSITQNNPNYSLAGAKYGLYQNSAQVLQMSIGEDGSTPVYEVEPGNYTLQEIEAPKGYALSYQTVQITIDGNSVSEAPVLSSLQDKPQVQQMNLLLQKESTKENSPSLAGAVFEVKYYAISSDTAQNPAELGYSPKRIWQFQTDKNGEIYFNSEYLISGDALYWNETDGYFLPLGVLTIQEVQAPSGYWKNSDVFTMPIKAQGNGPYVQSYTAPTVLETPLEIELIKKDSTNAVLAGAVFEHTRPDGSSVQLQSDANGKITLSWLTEGEHSLKEIQAPAGYIVQSDPCLFTVSSQSISMKTLPSYMSYDKDSLQLSITNSQNKITLVKTDASTGKTIAGAVFEITAPDGSTKKITTTNGGKIILSGLQTGLHTVKEISAPSGYFVTDEVFTLHVSQNGITVEGISESGSIKVPSSSIVSIANTPVRLELIKTDSKNSPLENAKFLHTLPDGSTQELLTNADGRITFEYLMAGEHALQEIEAPDGYRVCEETVSFTVTGQDIEFGELPESITLDKEKNQLTWKDAPVSFEVLKMDAVTKEVLENAEFIHVLPDGSNETLTTNAQGKISFEKLSFGKHTLQEVKAPSGYLAESDILTFTISQNGIEWESLPDFALWNPEELLLEIQNAPAEFEIVKTDSENDEPLAGARFEHTLPDGTREILETDENGAIQLAYVEPGEHTLVEIQAPAGYVLCEKEIRFAADQNGISLMESEAACAHVLKTETGLQIQNERSKLILIKQNEDGKYVLENAEFQLTEPDGNIQKLVSDANGEIELEKLQEGEHMLKETKAPEGYLVYDKTVSFTVKDGKVHFETETEEGEGLLAFDDETSTLYFGNFSLPLQLQIFKTDTSKNVLSGAEFTLYADKECTKKAESITTGKDGSAVFETLIESGDIFYLKETKAPDGYVLDEEVYEVKWSSEPAAGSSVFSLAGKDYPAEEETSSVIFTMEENYISAKICIANKAAEKTVPTGIRMQTWLFAFASTGAGVLALYAAGKSRRKR